MNLTRQPLQESCRRKLIWRWIRLSFPSPPPVSSPYETFASRIVVSATNASQNEGKIAYIKLNTPAACPPRTVVPVNTGARFGEFISSQRARFAFGEGCDSSSYVAEFPCRCWPVNTLGDGARYMPCLRHVYLNLDDAHN